MAMTPDQLRKRTKEYALRLIHLAEALPKSIAGQVMARQIIRSGTAVAANYRAACRSRSYSEFAAKIGVVAEEADECQFWLEMIVAAGLKKQNLVDSVMDEAGQLVAIMTATRRTAQMRKGTKKKPEKSS